MIEQYNIEIDFLNQKIEALQNELRQLLKKRRQLKKSIYLYKWRKKKRAN